MLARLSLPLAAAVLQSVDAAQLGAARQPDAVAQLFTAFWNGLPAGAKPPQP
jgi:hypothetical protein